MKWLISFIAAFIVSAVLGKLLIPFLIRLKFGQEIREIGPKWHQKKSGTPTMGGIMFILAFAIGIAVFVRDLRAVMVAVCAVLFGIIGFTDDFIKVVKKRNLGLTALQKFMAQLVVASAFVFVLMYTGMIDTAVIFPFIGTVNLGWALPPLAVIFMVGMVNGVNLTDGVDGLAGFVSLIVTLFFAVAAGMTGYTGLGISAAIAAGAILGFLVYNAHPAQVFMGDTGSLFLGGFITAVSIAMGFEIFLIICGIMFIVETLSVMLQVASFKPTGKRIFKMSPIHHHFEMCGFSENKIVIMFSLITLVACIIAYLAV